jgi:hypothetical protein
MAEVLDILDSEMNEILKVLEELRQRGSAKKHNYLDFEREIKGRFAEIGFEVDISWYEYAMGAQAGPVAGSAMPEVTITGRTERKEFDRDQMVHEVTHNLLGLPGQEGVIKTDPATLKRFTGGQGSGHGHAH